MSWLNALPRACVRLGAAHPRLVLCTVAVLVVLGAWATSTLRVELDVLSLMPKEDPEVALFRSTLEQFGSIDLMLFAVELPPPRTDRENAFDFVDELASELQQLAFESSGGEAEPALDWLQYRAEELIEDLLALQPWASLWLGPKELTTFGDSLSDQGLRDNADLLRRRLRTPLGLGDTRWVRRDPLNLLPLLLERLGPAEALASPNGSRNSSDSGYFVADERDGGGGLLLMVGKPHHPAADIQASRRLLQSVDAKVAELTESYAAEGIDTPQVLVGGGPAIAVADSQQIQNDMLIGTGAALLAVTLLFALAFGRPLALLYAVLPLASGLLLTAGVTSLVFGRLNATTSIFAAMLIGLGVDFVIVLYGRYTEERIAGFDDLAAFEQVAQKTAASLTIAATTTGLAMLAFLIADFDGLVELGVVTCVGILLVLVTVCLTLPALLRATAGDRVPAPLRTFGLVAPVRFAQRWPRTVLLASGAVSLVLAAFVPRLAYHDDALRLRSSENPAALVERRVSDAFGMRFIPYLLRVDGGDQASVLQHLAELEPRLQELVVAGDLARFESIGSVLPSPVAQETVLRQLRSWNLDCDTLASRISDSLLRSGLQPAAFTSGIEAAAHAACLTQPLPLDELRRTTVGPLLDRYLQRSDDGWAALVYTYTEPDRWRRRPPPALEQLVEESAAEMTGPVTVSAALKRVVLRDAARSGTVALLIVVILLRLGHGNWLHVARALIPLVLGTVWLLGLVGLFGVEINFLNLFVFPMLIGIAVDYGVHLTHRAFEEPSRAAAEVDPDLDNGQLATGRAVAVAALTTMLGFGSLAFSSFPGLQSMGVVAILGCLCCAVAALTVLPAIDALESKSSLA